MLNLYLDFKVQTMYSARYDSKNVSKEMQTRSRFFSLYRMWKNITGDY